MWLIASCSKRIFLFYFDNSLYCQIDGTAMGSPWGPTLASAFSCHYEKEWLNSCTTEFKPKVYKRYVDDIFVMFQSRDHIKRFVEINQNRFSFWDIKIITNTQKKSFETSIYSKNTLSFLPITYKFGLLETMLFHCFSIWSSYEKFHEEIMLKEIFGRKSYPEKFIDRCKTNFTYLKKKW